MIPLAQRVRTCNKCMVSDTPVVLKYVCNTCGEIRNTIKPYNPYGECTQCIKKRALDLQRYVPKPREYCLMECGKKIIYPKMVYCSAECRKAINYKIYGK